MRKILALLAIAITIPFVSHTTQAQTTPFFGASINDPNGMIEIDTTQFPNGPVNYEIAIGGVLYTGTFFVNNQVGETPQIKGPIETVRELLIDKGQKADYLQDQFVIDWPADGFIIRDGFRYDIGRTKPETINNTRSIRAEIQATDIAARRVVFDDFIRIVNPVFRIPDGTFHSVITIDRDGLVIVDKDGEPVTHLIGNYIEDIREAYFLTIIDTIKTATKNGDRLPSKRGTTTTVFADTADGRISSAHSSVWNTCRDGGAGATVNVNTTDSSNAFSLEADNWGGTNCFIHELFFFFDTSAIPDTDTIDDATFSLVADGNSSSTGSGIYEVREYDWGATLTVGDRIDLTTSAWTDNTLLATLAMTSWTATDNTRNDWVEQAGFAGAIDKTGDTHITVMSDDGYAATVPSGSPADYSVGAHFADDSGTTNDPRLIVNHSAAGGARRKIQIRID